MDHENFNISQQSDTKLLATDEKILSELNLNSLNIEIKDLSSIIHILETQDKRMNIHSKCYIDNKTKEAFIEINENTPYSLNKSFILSILNFCEKENCLKVSFCIKKGTPDIDKQIKSLLFVGFENNDYKNNIDNYIILNFEFKKEEIKNNENNSDDEIYE